MTTATDPISTVIEFPEKLQPLFRPYRFKILYGGRDGLKSWSIARALLLMAVQRPLRILCCREIQNSLKESVHKLLSDQIEALGLSEHYEILETEIRGKFLHSQFLFTGLEKQTKESMKSFEGIDIAWVEEAANVSKGSWNILEPTIRKEGSEIWISFNPNMDTDETYIRFVLHPPEQSFVVEMNWRDNLWTSTASDLARRTMRERSEEEYQHVYEGKPRTATPGSVYAREVTDLVSHGRYAPCPYDARLKVHTIWDLGWSDSCTIHLVQSDMLALRIIGYLEGRHMLTSEWGALLNAMPLNWGWDWLPHDGYSAERKTGQSDYRILVNMGRRVRGQADSVPGPSQVREEEGMRELRRVFPRISLHNGNGLDLLPAHAKNDPQKAFPGLLYWSGARLLECWKRFRYNVPKHGEPSLPVSDEYKHGCDGSRYMALVSARLSNEDQSSGRIPPIDFGFSQDRGMGALG